MSGDLQSLMDRLIEANAKLVVLADQTNNATEMFRLEAKASGVRLAISYVREAIGEDPDA